MAGEHLDGGDLPALQRCLHDWGLIAPGEVVKSAASAGEGNMNLTLRVVTGDRSIVVKQARPWVEKYPSIPAPINRSRVEVAFYEAVADRPAVAAAMPALLASDRQSCTLALEDLGHTGDLTCLYGGRRLGQAQVQGLAGWLSALHGAFAGAPAELLSNRDMRELNHEHIFVLPFAPGNGLDLDGHTPGLNDAASELLSDGAIATRAAEIGERYLADAGRTLLHGDFFPGSWLSATDGGVWIIDPEFAFVGDPEWDVGIFAAHLELSGHPGSTLASFLDAYHPGLTIDRSVVDAYAGAEILRRLLGVSQLPLRAGITRKRELLARGRSLLLDE